LQGAQVLELQSDGLALLAVLVEHDRSSAAVGLAVEQVPRLVELVCAPPLPQPREVEVEREATLARVVQLQAADLIGQTARRVGREALPALALVCEALEDRLHSSEPLGSRLHDAVVLALASLWLRAEAETAGDLERLAALLPLQSPPGPGAEDLCLLLALVLDRVEAGSTSAAGVAWWARHPLWQALSLGDGTQACLANPSPQLQQQLDRAHALGLPLNH
jgi:hypothetical protein